MTRWSSISLFLLLAVSQSSAAPPAKPDFSDRKGIEFFETKVRPVLANNCFECHGPKKQKGGLRLDSIITILEGGDTSPAIVPGKPSESLLIDAVNYGELYQMPPTGKLAAEHIQTLTQWVAMGAPWPKTEGTKNLSSSKSFDLEQRRREHWAWQPIHVQPPPSVRDQRWPTSDIDRYLLARLEAKGLHPSPPTDKRTLIRRITFDLIGLPPTPEEVEIFLADTSSNAFEKVVDRLLASKHFGERWARHWLDLVRYAESRGHEKDYTAPNAYQYRDYVIRAFNADLAYDQFVREHIAGDLLDPPRLHPKQGFDESILGTGFWFLGEWVHSPVDIRKDETDRFDNMIDVMSKTFLGLTIACARCHAHKFDAIRQEDYYALMGFLQSSSYRQVRFESMEHNKQISNELAALRGRVRTGLRKAIARIQQPVMMKLSDYLLAAREVILAGSKSKRASGDFTDKYRKKIDTLAEEHRLDGDLLAGWVAHLVNVRKKKSDPFHLWARIASDRNADSSTRSRMLIGSIIDTWEAEEIGYNKAIEGTKVIVDYAVATSGQWWQDGYTFGLGPIRPGDIELGSDPSLPIRKVFTYGAARRDPLWNVAELIPGSDKQVGRLEKLPRPGRTFRTPTFPIQTGWIYYLVKGSGYAYAAVDSHRMNIGPLHEKLITEWQDSGGNEPRWIAHDLRRYIGHRAHLEFTARDSNDLEILLVVEADHLPSKLEPPNHLLQSAFQGQELSSLGSLAKQYQRLFCETVEKFAADRIFESSNAASYADLADWMLHHPETWNLPKGTDWQYVEKEMELFLAAQARILERIQKRSKLALAMIDGDGEDDYILIRGNHKNPGQQIPRRFLEAIGGPNQSTISEASGRLELARRMLDSSNPFLPRVMVNRIWHHLFGRGIVASVDNFGVLGERPTHPLLLDHLADRFVREGWSVKKTIRQIVLTRAYRMSSQPVPSAESIDPDNLLLQRMSIRRLEGEAIRDSILMISGRLDPTMFGPSVPTFLTDFMQGRGRPKSGSLDGQGRRSIYIAIRRNFISSMMLAFDMPTPFSTMGRRNVSNVPAQALILMNDPFVVEQAKGWARRLLDRRDSTAEDRVIEMYESAFARPPTEPELSDALAFLDQMKDEYGLSDSDRLEDLEPWADLCHVMMNVKEFIYIH